MKRNTLKKLVKHVLTEMTDYRDLKDPDRGGFVSSAVRQLFRRGNPVVTFDDVEKIALSHIKDPDVAQDYAMKIGDQIATEHNYTADESGERYTKLNLSIMQEEVGNIRATYIALFRKALHQQDRRHVSKSHSFVDGNNVVFYFYFTYISQGAFDVIGEFVNKFKGALRIYPYAGPTCCVEITIANRTLDTMQKSAASLKEGVFKHDMPSNDPVGQYLTMMADMPDHEPPELKIWQLCVGNAEIALNKYKQQRIGLNESDDNWKRWVNSMVSTVNDRMIEDNIQKIDVGEAYDIIKVDFRAESPTRDMFDKACKEALTILKQQGKLK